MKKQKPYFCEAIDEEFAYPISYFTNEMKERELTEITVAEAIRDTDKQNFWCRAIGEAMQKDSDEPCGKWCPDYTPRNGKNGCCIHRGFCYEPGQEFTLTLDGKLTSKQPNKN